MPRTVSLDRCKMESAVFKIMALEEEIKETQKEYDALVADEGNWQALCKPCHDKKTGLEDSRPEYTD